MSARGNQPDEAHELLGALEPGEVAGLGEQSDRAQRVDAPHAAQPCDQLMVRALAGEMVEPGLQHLNATLDLINGEQVVIEGLLLARKLKRLTPKPRATRGAPGPRRHLTLVAQAELPEAMTGTQPVQTRVLPGADEVAQRLVLRSRDEDLCQQSRGVQSGQTPSVTLIGLHAVSGPRGHQSRRDDHAVDPTRDQGAVQSKAGRARLLADPCTWPCSNLTQQLLVVIAKRSLTQQLAITHRGQPD